MDCLDRIEANVREGIEKKRINQNDDFFIFYFIFLVFLRACLCFVAVMDEWASLVPCLDSLPIRS